MTGTSRGSGESATSEAAPADPSLGISRRIARSSVFSVIGRGIALVGWVAIAPFLLRRLGPERFGLWSIVSLLAGLSQTFDLGVAAALSRLVAEFRARADVDGLRRAVTLSIVLAFALVLAAFLLALAGRERVLDFFHVDPALRAEAGIALLGAVLLFALTTASNLQGALLGGVQRLDVWNVAALAAAVLQLAGMVIVVWRGGGLPSLIVVNAVALALGLVLAGRGVARFVPEARPGSVRGGRALATRMLRFGAALQIINLGVLFQFQLEKILFGRFVSLAAVGEFELGYRVVFALWAIPAFLLAPLLPAFAHLDAVADRERFEELFRRGMRYVFALAVPVTGGVLALAPALFSSWLGPGHANAALAARALAATLAVNVLTGVGSAAVRGIDRAWVEAEYQVLALALHLAASLTLIPRYGFRGGLLALFFSSLIGTAWFLIRARRVLKLPLGALTWQASARPWIATVVAVVPAMLLSGAGLPAASGWSRGEAAPRLLIGAGVYVALVIAGLLLTRALSVREVTGLLRLTRSPMPSPRTT